MRGTRVGLSELAETVRKLGRLTAAMGESVTKSKHATSLPDGALGSHRFVESRRRDDGIRGEERPHHPGENDGA